MSGLQLSLRATGRHPRRMLAVWVFCLAAIGFWAGVFHYAIGVGIGWMALVVAILALTAIPFAGHIAYIVWKDSADG